MNVVLKLTKPPQKDDLLIFDGNAFTPISKSALLSTLSHRVKSLEDENKEMKIKIDGKLKEFHDILKLLTKGE